MSFDGVIGSNLSFTDNNELLPPPRFFSTLENPFTLKKSRIKRGVSSDFFKNILPLDSFYQLFSDQPEVVIPNALRGGGWTRQEANKKKNQSSNLYFMDKKYYLIWRKIK